MSNNEQSTSNANNDSSDSFEEFGVNDVNYNRLFETDTSFDSQDEAFDWAQKIAFNNGFALVRRTRKKIDPEKPEKTKKRGTAKCDCLFRIRTVQDYVNHINGKKLVVMIILTSEKGGYHNHEVTKYKDGGRHYAGLDAEEKDFVRQQVRASIPPRDIKNGLHQRTPDNLKPTSGQIYSEANKVQREMRGTWNPAQQLLALAVAAQYVEWHKSDLDSKELSHVFMFHLEAVKLFRAYLHVALIDFTYKTKVYKIALVEVVGVTPCGSSLIDILLLPSESEADYGWMLGRLEELLSCTGSFMPAFVTDRELGLIGAIESLYPNTPHLLCRWHLNRAVEKEALNSKNLIWYKDMIMHCKESGRYRVINASTVEEFRSALDSYCANWEVLAGYVIRTWGKYRKKFVALYTNQYFHLGNTATSRVESSHSLLKSWLKSHNLNLDTMWARIHSMLEPQHSKIRHELEVSRSKPRSGIRFYPYCEDMCLPKSLRSWKLRLREGLSSGTGWKNTVDGWVRVTHGLPCATGYSWVTLCLHFDPIAKNG